MRACLSVLFLVVFVCGCPFISHDTDDDVNAEVTSDRSVYDAAPDERILDLQAIATISNLSDVPIYVHRRRHYLEKKVGDDWKLASRYAFKLALSSHDAIEVKPGSEHDYVVQVVTYIEGQGAPAAFARGELKANVNPMPAEFVTTAGEYRIVLYAYESFDMDDGFKGQLPFEMTTSNPFQVR